MRTAFENNISTRVIQLQSEPEPESLNERWQRLKQLIKEEASNTLGFRTQGDRNTWFDDECAQVTTAKNEARIKSLERNTRAANENYRALRRAEKRVHKRKKREQQDREFNDLQHNRITKLRVLMGFQPRY